MKLKNQVQRFLFILCVAFTIFSCDEDKQVIEKLPTIVEITKADANFSILVDALKKTGLDVTLNNPGSYTVFAPTNTAFAAINLNSATINGWNAVTDKALIDNLRLVLQNHVLGVGTRADDLVAFGYSRTFVLPSSRPGNNLFVSKTGNDFLINGGVATTVGAKITKSDIDASNGVVHVIDRILGQPTIADHLIANPDLSTLLTVVNSTSGTFGNQAIIKNALVNATSALPLTVFAPNNAAFKKATDPGGYLTGATVTEANIRKILQYHVSAGNLTSGSATAWIAATAAADATVTTLATVGTTTTAQRFRIEKGTVKLTEIPALPTTVPASLIKVVNIQATNGVIHIIDRVLQPVL
jgi:uncharacterized surface protein with fasciclin (FAS1) repeats